MNKRKNIKQWKKNKASSEELILHKFHILMSLKANNH